MQDRQIVGLYWERNQEAIRQTQQKYQAYLSKIACNILADVEDSKECVNDTYLAAWNSIPPHRPAVLSAYLGKITRQLAIDVFRRKHSRKRYASEYALSLSELSDVIATEETPEPRPFDWPEPRFEGMGHESYWMREFDAFRTGNPWTPELRPDTLPVYRSTLLAGEARPGQSGDPETMEEILLTAAARLGLEPHTLELGDNAASAPEQQEIRDKYEEVGMTPPPEENLGPTAVYGEAEGVRIQVDSTLRVTIRFRQPRAYPQDVLDGATGLEREERKTAWLAVEYADLLDMERPAAVVTGGDAGGGMEPRYSKEICEAAGSDLEQILQYNFFRAEFCDDEDGNLVLIRLRVPDLTDLLGDYPAITPEQARQDLLAGRYVTSVPYEVPSSEAIAHVELVYRGESYDPLYVPYYKFYVDVTDAPGHGTGESGKGLREYGVYYVPAIAPEYLTSLPLWDGKIG